MSVYDLHFNKDDVSIRSIIVGLLATINNEIKWKNQLSSDIKDYKIIDVPFYFSTTGTERYLQDNFLNNIDFDKDKLKAEAFYNKVPRGIVQYTGISIETQNIVNKYVRMNHQKQEEDGTLNTYNSECFWVPILLSFDVKVYVDSILDQLKCTEALIQTFFKSKSYQVDVTYTRIPCLISFPDSYSNERSVEYSFTDKKEFTVEFSIEVKSHIPIFKDGTAIFAGNTMDTFEHGVYIPPLNYGPEGNQTTDAKLNSNDGTPKADGQLASKYEGPVPETPSWPIIPESQLPPDGGSTASNQ